MSQAPQLFPRFTVGDVIITPWGNKPGRPLLVEKVYEAKQGGRAVIAYETQAIEDPSAYGWGRFTEEAEEIERVAVLQRKSPLSA